MQDRNALVTRTKPTRSERASGALYHQIKAIRYYHVLYRIPHHVTRRAPKRNALFSHPLDDSRLRNEPGCCCNTNSTVCIAPTLLASADVKMV